MGDEGRAGARMFSACTLNVRGLCSVHKLAATLAWAQEQPYTAVILQECHLRESPLEWARGQGGADMIWKGHAFYEPGTGHADGCWVLLKPSALITGVRRFQPPIPVAVGRVVRVDFELLGRPSSLVCVYAPARAHERPRFFTHTLPAYLPRRGERTVLLGGDFNCITDTADYIGPTERGEGGPEGGERREGGRKRGGGAPP